MSEELIKSLAVTAELTGTQLSRPAAQVLAEDLMQYPEPAVLQALARCRRELKGRLTLAEIIARIDDGRPSADEAWAMLAWDEDTTAVITTEMQEAQGAAWQSYQHGDKAGARYAFRDAYNRLVGEARDARQPVRWTVSLGWDKAGREGVLQDAVRRGRLSAAVAQRYLPDAAFGGARRIAPERREEGLVPLSEALKRWLPGAEGKEA